PRLPEMGERQARKTFQSLAVAGSDPPTVLDPFGESKQLAIEHRGLDVVQQRGIPVAVVFARRAILAVVAEQARQPGDAVVVRGQGPPVAEASENLERVETEAASEPERAGTPTVVARAQRLRRILDHRKTVARGEGQDPIHRTHPP